MGFLEHLVEMDNLDRRVKVETLESPGGLVLPAPKGSRVHWDHLACQVVMVLTDKKVKPVEMVLTGLPVLLEGRVYRVVLARRVYQVPLVRSAPPGLLVLPVETVVLVFRVLQVLPEDLVQVEFLEDQVLTDYLVLRDFRDATVHKDLRVLLDNPVRKEMLVIPERPDSRGQ